MQNQSLFKTFQTVLKLQQSPWKYFKIKIRSNKK